MNIFFSTMAHQLKTPLNSIMAMTQQIQALMKKKDKATQQIATYIYANAVKLNHLVNCTLDVSQLKAGQFRTKFQKCNII